jgi:hypothetical protein
MLLDDPHKQSPERRPRSSLPPLLEEHGGVIAVAFISFVVLVSVAFSGVNSGAPAGPVTQIKIILGPLKTYAKGSSDRLEFVSAKVRNIGTVRANRVAVNVSIGGQIYSLSGSDSIEPGPGSKPTLG